MGRLNKIIALFFILFSQQIIFAQQSTVLNEKLNPSVDETVFINLNTTTFVNGETLYYKLNCLKTSDKKPSTISKIAYVELIDSNKKVIFKNKLFLENGSGQGDYFIPSNLKTGNYKLIGYTNWMLNLSVSEIFQIDITILNPFQETDLALKSPNSIPNPSEKTTIDLNSLKKPNFSSNENIKLSANKKTFSNRELVNLKVESMNQFLKNGNYSLSVRKIDSLPTKQQISAVTFYAENNTSKIDKTVTILPELRGEIFSGKITSKDSGKEIQNILIALSIPGNSFIYKVVKTNKDGSFIFNIDKAYHNPNIIVQVISDDPTNYTLTLDNPQQPKYQELSIKPELNLNPEIKNSLIERTVATQIENAFYNIKKDSIPNYKITNPFYSPIAIDYVLDDYTRFSTLKETIIEVVKEMYFIQKDKNFNMYVRDVNIVNQSTEPPIIIVDGLLIQNQNELFDYKMDNVYKISIIPGPYILGPKTFNGLVSIITKNKDYVTLQKGNYILDTTVLKPNSQKIYYQQDYTNPLLLERIPDYRYQLLWNPELNLDESNTLISFYTSDIKGIFEINIEGFTYEGIPISVHDSFEVK